MYLDNSSGITGSISLAFSIYLLKVLSTIDNDFGAIRFLCTYAIWLDNLVSVSIVGLSSKRKRRSKRDNKAEGRWTFYNKLFLTL